jgi:hypothetical protein
MICYEIETWQDECRDDPSRVVHRLRLGVAKLFKRKDETWTLRDTLRFTQQEQFVAFVLHHSRRREPLWVYAHNAAFAATIVGLWEQLDFETFRLTDKGRTYVSKRTRETITAKDWHGRIAADNIPFIVEARSDYGTVKFVDTLNYIAFKLAELGKWVGLTKFGYPSEAASDSDWYSYCERSVDILSTTVLKLMAMWNGRKLGTWQMTMAGLSFSCFRHLEPYSGIVVHGHDPDEPADMAAYWIDGKPFPLDAYDVSRIERRAFYGGQVKCAFLGDVVPEEETIFKTTLHGKPTDRPKVVGPATVFDVNGLYAYCMVAYPQPIELIDAIEDVELTKASQLISDFLCIADVDILSPRMAWPVRVDKRTVFARGHFTTTLTGPELRSAIQLGCVTAVRTLCLYHAGNPYKDFVKYWWKMRQDAIANGDLVTSKLCKSIIVALAGKLGQRTPTWQLAPDITAPRQWGPFIHNSGQPSKFIRCRAIAGVTQTEGEREDCKHTFTAGAAFITSYGRTFMRRLWEACPPRSVLYQDTDSLFCLPVAVEALVAASMVDATGLGKLKCEGTYTHLSIYGPKNYDKNGVPTVAGLSSNATQVRDRQWDQWQFERAASIVGRQPDGTVQSWLQSVNAAGSQPGFSVHEDGWTTPIRLGVW